MKKDKMNLGTLIEWEEIKKPNHKACWSLRDTFAVFIRDYLYEFANMKKYGYPPDIAPQAINTVVEQAELMASNDL